MTTFAELGLIAPLLKAIEAAGYTDPTPIQAKAIKPVLDGHDLLGIAQTGTGKTAAFALPILQRLAADKKLPPRKGCRVLVLSPTRELATQIGETFRTLGAHMGISVAVIFGGVSHRPQISALARGLDVLVATPGRLLDHVAERNCVLAPTEVFVLDEADQMLDLGFFKPIRRVVAQLNVDRQSLFFSATMPKEIEALTAELLRNPVKVEVAPRSTTVELINQRVIHVEHNRKRSLLLDLLTDPAMSRTLVFTRTKRGADKVAKYLDGYGTKVSAIHGNKSQKQREEALDAFKEGDIRVLVATDIAARGIDVSMVTHVVNYELPEVPEAYVHRIGRTARAGASGIAISLCDTAERGLLRDIEKLTRQTIPATDRRNDASLEVDTTSKALDRSDRGGRGGDRGGRGGDRGGDRNRGGRSGGPRQGAGNGGGDRASAGRSGGSRFADRAERADRGGPSAGGQRTGGPRTGAARPSHSAPRDGARREETGTVWSNREDRPRAPNPALNPNPGWVPATSAAPTRGGFDERPARSAAPGGGRDQRNGRPQGERPREGGAGQRSGGPSRDGGRDGAPRSANRAPGRAPGNGGFRGRPSGDRSSPRGDRT